MVKYILIMIFIFNLIIADHNRPNYFPYISPGIEIGYGNKMFHYSFQISIGLMNHEHPIIPGITLGKRFYRNKIIWDSFNYVDLQCSITPLIGFGIGKFYNNKEEYYKYKIWAGMWGLLSYDYLNFIKSPIGEQQKINTKYNPYTGELIKTKYLKHNFGGFFVFPIINPDKF